jgi:hypothetical protein
MILTRYVLLTYGLLTVSSHDVLKLSMEEKVAIDTPIADLTQELMLQSLASYTLVELLPINEHLFSIDKQTGRLVTRSIIDREQLCVRHQCSCDYCTLVFQLIAIETSGRRLEKVLEIHIKDLNDHSPTFDKESMIHIIHIKTNVPLGYRIVLPSASDHDEGIVLDFVDHACI